MADIFDLAPSALTVAVRGVNIDVGGISLGDFLKILKRFPDLITKLKGGEVEADKWFDLGADAISAIISAGCGKLGDEKAEAVIARLSAMDQMDLLEPILAQTMPDGAGPFVQRITKALGLNATLSLSA